MEKKIPYMSQSLSIFNSTCRSSWSVLLLYFWNYVFLSLCNFGKCQIYKSLAPMWYIWLSFRPSLWVVCEQRTWDRRTLDFASFELEWSASDDFITISRLQSTQLKYFDEKSKLTTAMWEILDGFSLVWLIPKRNHLKFLSPYVL